MSKRREMSPLYLTIQQATESLSRRLAAQIAYPPMWPITDIRVEQRLVGRAGGPECYRWAVVGDYSAWPS